MKRNGRNGQSPIADPLLSAKSGKDAQRSDRDNRDQVRARTRHAGCNTRSQPGRTSTPTSNRDGSQHGYKCKNHSTAKRRTQRPNGPLVSQLRGGTTQQTSHLRFKAVIDGLRGARLYVRPRRLAITRGDARGFDRTAAAPIQTGADGDFGCRRLCDGRFGAGAGRMAQRSFQPLRHFREIRIGSSGRWLGRWRDRWRTLRLTWRRSGFLVGLGRRAPQFCSQRAERISGVRCARRCRFRLLRLWWWRWLPSCRLF
jgi:hypothetical protein